MTTKKLLDITEEQLEFMWSIYDTKEKSRVGMIVYLIKLKENNMPVENDIMPPEELRDFVGKIIDLLCGISDDDYAGLMKMRNN